MDVNKNPVTFPHTHTNNAANTQTDTTSRCWVASVMLRVLDGAHLCSWLLSVLLCDVAQAAGRGVQELSLTLDTYQKTGRRCSASQLTEGFSLLRLLLPSLRDKQQLCFCCPLSPPFTRTVAAAATEGRLGAADCDQQVSLSPSVSMSLLQV